MTGKVYQEYISIKWQFSICKWTCEKWQMINPDLVSNTWVIKSWETFWNTHWWMVGNLNMSQCSWSIFTHTCACVKLCGNMPKSEWIDTNKALGTKIGFRIEHRYQSGIVHLVRDEFQPKEREFYQLFKIVVPRLMLDNFNFIHFPKKLSFLQMQVFESFAWVSNSERTRKIQKHIIYTRSKKKTRRIFSSIKFNK